MVPGPGIYFINAYVDDQLVATAVLPAEIERPQYSYNLSSEDSARVEAGELLILLKRAKLRPASPQEEK